MRKFAVHLFSFLFTFTFSIFMLAYVLNSTIGSKDRMQSWITEADTINLAVTNVPYVLNELTTEATKDNPDETIKLNLDDAAKLSIGENLKVPLGTNLLSPIVSNLINDFYVWLYEDQYKPFTTSINLAANNDELKAALVNIITENPAIVPACTDSGEGICLDRHTTPSVFVDKLFEQIGGEEGVLKTIDISTDGESAKTFESIHSGYRTFKTVFMWLMITVFVWAALAVLVGKDKLQDLKTLSRYFLGAFTLPVILTLIALMILPNTYDIGFGSDFGTETEAAAIRVISPLITTVASSVAQIYLTITLPLLILSIAGVVFIHRKHKEQVLAASKPKRVRSPRNK